MYYNVGFNKIIVSSRYKHSNYFRKMSILIPFVTELMKCFKAGYCHFKFTLGAFSLANSLIVFLCSGLFCNVSGSIVSLRRNIGNHPHFNKEISMRSTTAPDMKMLQYSQESYEYTNDYSKERTMLKSETALENKVQNQLLRDMGLQKFPNTKQVLSLFKCNFPLAFNVNFICPW